MERRGEDVSIEKLCSHLKQALEETRKLMEDAPGNSVLDDLEKGLVQCTMSLNGTSADECSMNINGKSLQDATAHEEAGNYGVGNGTSADGTLPKDVVEINGLLYPNISAFLDKIKDQDWTLRCAAVFQCSIVAREQPDVMKELLPATSEELIRTVDLGPYTKHRIDDGLELRKLAFKCVDTLLDDYLDQLDASSFIVPYLLSGLDDDYDVKMICHLILVKLADKCPSAVLAVLDSLVDPIQKTLNFKLKEDAVKIEVNLNENMIGSALTAVAALNRISGADGSPKFKTLVAEIEKSQPQQWEKSKFRVRIGYFRC